MQYKKVLGVTGGRGFTSGAPNKAIMLVGTNASVRATDMYGNTFMIDHQGRQGSSIFPIQVASIDEAEVTNGVYVLF
tara:strand:+ start:478 stop:708 length:231 start_codon:yes stop_codon:yes gene_type:complete